MMPNIEQNNLSSVVAQLEALAVLVFAFDLRRLFADR
jgi:hypothetical protein